MSTEVQRLLRRGVYLADLCEKHGLKAVSSQYDPLVILNYDQRLAKKRDPIASECRALVLEKDTWEVVARSFSRFLKVGECPDLEKSFRWDEFSAEEKCDGSLMLLYRYRDLWMVNTRGSFAQGEISPGYGKCWEECFWDAVPNEKAVDELNTGTTYVFEYCSRLNKVVRDYPEPTLYLLSGFHNRTGRELAEYELDQAASRLGVKRPERYAMASLPEIVRWLDGHDDPTFEGVVLRDKNGLRLKVKNKQYVALHALKNNGNLFATKNIIPLVLKGETAEVLCHFPELADNLYPVVERVEGIKARMNSVWDYARNLKSQKDFAIFVNKHTEASGFLFEARKRNISPNDVWEERGEDFLVRHLRMTT